MTVRTEQLYFGQPTVSTTVVVYTAPDGYRTIVKEIIVTNGQPTAGEIYVVAVKQGGSINTGLIPKTLGANDRQRHERWSVLEAGDELRVYTDKSGTTLLISGTELEL